VRKETDPGDGRGTIVCLTDEGHDMYRRVGAIHAQAIHQHMSVLSPAELRTLETLTDKLRQAQE
jgi:DNA-binding MarR family transcriptional regulator